MNKEWIFKNSPFEMLDIAFKKLFSDIRYTAYLDDDIRADEDSEKVYGATHIDEDRKITIFLDYNLTINNAVEVFAHELAHAAVGAEHDHDEVWEKAFEDLFEEYHKIGDEMFGVEE